MLPGLVALFPDLAEGLLAYRSHRLPAAQDTARRQGMCGNDASTDAGASRGDSWVPCAVWPWESALLGFGVNLLMLLDFFLFEPVKHR